jgi:hypothetical protein
MSTKKYFVLCKYQGRYQDKYLDQYPAEAIFVRTDSPLMKKNRSKITKLKSLIRSIPHGTTLPIIQKIYSDEHKKKFIGCIINGKIDTSTKTKSIIEDWPFFTMDDISDEDSDDIFIYHINDKNKYLSPRELYGELFLLTKCCGQDVCVKECIMLSNEQLDYEPPIILRFYINTIDWLSHDELINILMSDLRIKSVKPICVDDMITGYGYIWLNKIGTAIHLLQNKKVFVEGLKFYFSCG